MKLKQHQRYLEELFATESERLQKLHEIVTEAIKEEELLTDHLSTENEEDRMSLGDRISTKAARFVGSWAFIISFCFIFGSWIILNTLIVLKPFRFDPFPFDIIKLTLLGVASIQGPLIMMSQNRQAAKERKRNENQYLINLKAEIEVRNINKKIDLLMKEQIKNLLEVQKVQMDLIEKLYVKLDKLKEMK